tara:strand:- start:283 stop:468 length:186 start_codon:yes stop_codon:yes gene_type:complete
MLPFYTLNLNRDEYYVLEDLMLDVYLQIKDQGAKDLDEESFLSLCDKLPAVNQRIINNDSI